MTIFTKGYVPSASDQQLLHAEALEGFRAAVEQTSRDGRVPFRRWSWDGADAEFLHGFLACKHLGFFDV